MNTEEHAPVAIMQLPDFWNQVTRASNRFLGLDYDGTLAPFAIDPMQAQPLDGVAALIRSLNEECQTEVAIISGRPVAEIMALLDNPPVTVVGSHGYELWPRHGTCMVRRPSATQQLGLDRIENDLLQRGLGDRLEHKVASLAVHTRGLDPSLALAVEEEVAGAWSPQGSRFALECRRFNGGIEIRCPGRDKGTALSELLADQPDATLAVYIGDDDTDEDAFTVLRGNGIGIKVGDPSWPTAAHGFLPDCHAVSEFLHTWVRLTSTKGKKYPWI